jgi:glutamate formiminotransferase
VALIECVPNVSEGRRSEIVAALAEAIRGAGGVRLLDCSADAAHHRSVFTFAGPPEAIARAVIALFARAVADIDLRTHRGEHPRLGAVDVVPLVPLDGADMAACVQLARSIGAEVAERFQVPIFLYGEAASSPARKPLENLRRGGFEGLAARMQTAEWAPDFGPATPHPTAGASIIGARPLLIAYNVNLDSTSIEVARAVAASVRTRTGGLPAVKALGLRLGEHGVAQVSMNLTNYQETSIRQAFDAVTREAGHRGVGILDSEIVGLAPAAALDRETAEHIKLRNFSEDLILERRLAGSSG